MVRKHKSKSKFACSLLLLMAIIHVLNDKSLILVKEAIKLVKDNIPTEMLLDTQLE